MRAVSALALTLGLALAACAGGITRDQEVLKKLHPGMTTEEVRAAVGAESYRKAAYANGTSSWTYKYNEANIHKLMHIIFDADGRVLRVETEWDPDVYSKKR
jgi:hypothetical protein